MIDALTRHELLNWLNQIIGYSEMLIEEADGSGQENLIGDLGKITCAAQQMLVQLQTPLTCSPSCHSAINTNDSHKQTASPDQVAHHFNPVDTECNGRGSLLVVDDNPANQEILSRRLENQGYQIAMAGSGVEALEKLTSNRFDLVLLDVMMPDMGGYEVLQRMKADTVLRNIPVIMISACSDMGQVILCIEAGAEDYLPKPFNSTLLKARISATLEKKRLCEQERRYASQAMQTEAALERHRALTQAVAGVAHEINTPLGIVKTGLSIIRNRLSLPNIQALFRENSETEALLQDMLESSGLTIKNVDIAHRLIENFKKIAVDQLLEHQDTVDLPALLKDTVDLFKISARQARLDIRLDASGILKAREWHGYPGYLTQIMMNFLQNIERYAYPNGIGGQVDIAVSDRVLPAKAPQFVLTVRDYGAGINPEHIGKIFDPFFTTGRGKGGTGLGLAIVNNMVTVAMQGAVSVESEPGFGTCFTLCFPKNLT
ncbi:MAG: hybrid sensor histidine kinase/response regulator [Methylococcaceae bacterium]|nr:hybrid sensor histidine kinase/response regulator [Methylococcaceae bacterium]